MEDLKKYKNQLITYPEELNFSKDITFGFEMEFENISFEKTKKILESLKEKNSLYNGYSAKTDVSNLSIRRGLLTNGEISSCILIDEKEHWKCIKELLLILKEENAVITNKCGTHVNIGAHILEGNVEYFRNFLLLWKLYEEEIFLFSTGEYKNIRDYTYIKPIRDKINVSNILNLEIDSKKYINNFQFISKKNCNSLSLKKYESSNFRENNVIEFRTPNGTLDINILKNYLNFFVKFLLKCKEKLDIESIIYKIENKDHDVFKLANFIFDNKQDKDNFLIQSLNTNKMYKKKIKSHLYSK